MLIIVVSRPQYMLVCVGLILLMLCHSHTLPCCCCYGAAIITIIAITILMMLAVDAQSWADAMEISPMQCKACCGAATKTTEVHAVALSPRD